MKHGDLALRCDSDFKVIQTDLSPVQDKARDLDVPWFSPVK